jgi:gamma-glutamyltranspeptidase/glutathione hydrolase
MPRQLIEPWRVFLFGAAILIATTASAQIVDDTVRCLKGAVVCVSRPAARVGLETLERGGNAVDAAVATAFALAVTYPAAGNIAGGGYMLVVPAADKSKTESFVVDFRETAPAAATREMFVDPAARTPHRRVGVPGTVHGLAMAHERFGRLPWRELVMPAVRLARNRFVLDEAVSTELNKVLADTDKSRFAALHHTYGRADGEPWSAGDSLMLLELADTLERIAQQGSDGFYKGATAQLIVAEMQRGGGILTADDLAGYRPIMRQPLRSTYRDCEILGVPPSSSGGTTLVEALNILENFDLRAQGRWSAATLHLMIESMRRAYRDRAAYLGDPATTSIPDKLLDKAYAKQLAATIDPHRATPSASLAGEITLAEESPQTTHLSVMDADRSAVSLTYTLESAFGGRVVVPGGGFLLNDEMNDFNWLPDVTDRTGKIGTPPNQIAPGKRMLSSMCPVVVRNRSGHTQLITGSPGGRTISNTVLEVVVNVVDFKMSARPAVDSPRFHHGWFPDRVRPEAALAQQYPNTLDELRSMGHAIGEPVDHQGDAHTIGMDPSLGRIVGAADRRISGCAAGR